jgi:type IV pilus assembly protein PilA
MEMRKLIRRPEGFTLIELMIVILIIAILVAIAVPVFLNARASAQKRTCQANIRTVDGAIQSYQAQTEEGTYPNSLADMTASGSQVLKKIPTCPVATNAYGFITAAGNTGTPPYISCPNSGSHTI